MHLKYKKTIEQVTTWCQEETGIAGCILIGSQARAELPADEWSDMDLMVLAQDPAVWLDDNSWLERFGKPIFIFKEVNQLHFTDWDWCIQRVLYDDSRDIDFSILPDERLEEVLQVNQEILRKGWYVLYDAKPGRLETEVRSQLRHSEISHFANASQTELDELVQNLLFHVIWAFKKIKRKELWTAVACINCYLRGLLLRLIEAHTRAVSGKTSFINYEGRFLELRSDEKIIRQLKDCFSRYDEAEAIYTLGRLIEIAHLIAKETYAANGYDFREEPFEGVRRLYNTML